VIYIVGLLARSGHGKTTVARYLAEAYRAEVRSLADPMKRAVQKVFDFSTEQLWGSQATKEAIDPRYGFSPRWLLQRLGTEGLRDEFGEDVHVQALLQRLRLEADRRPAQGSAPRLVVVDDLRFPSDARFITAGGGDFRGAVLKIVSTDAPLPPGPAHASEQAIDDVQPADVAFTVTSSRAQGLAHLLANVDAALCDEAFARIRPALTASRSPAGG
jgi:hypothetical protein